MVSVNLFLFGKPAQELDKEGESITANDILGLDRTIHARLQTVADAIKRLTADGWDTTMNVYDLSFFHPEVTTVREAKKRLRGLHLELDDFQIHEEQDEPALSDDN